MPYEDDYKMWLEKMLVDEPQTCDTCKFEDCDREKYPCVYCINEDKMWQPKDEPQTERSSE